MFLKSLHWYEMKWKVLNYWAAGSALATTLPSAAGAPRHARCIIKHLCSLAAFVCRVESLRAFSTEVYPRHQKNSPSSNLSDCARESCLALSCLVVDYNPLCLWYKETMSTGGKPIDGIRAGSNRPGVASLSDLGQRERWSKANDT